MEVKEMTYKTDKWFTSPWNFADEIKAQMNFAPQIELHDVTLRDGEQQAGVTFLKDDKIRIAEKLAEAGIHRIEAGMPAVSKQDEEAIKEIVKRKLGPKIFAFGRCMKEDVKRAVDCGVDGIVVEIPSSEHIIKYAYKWPLEKAIDLSIEATLYAKENGLYTVFFPIDASRADINWFLDLIQRIAKEGHMDALAVVDTFGGCSPSAIPYLIRKIKERIDKPLETHFHDDFGLGAANTILGLAAGANVAHTTVSALGERAGNAAYEDVALALLTMYGVDLGIKTEMMYEISKLVRGLAGIEVRGNRGIIGDDIFKIESGIISGWLKNCGQDHALELSPYRWELVGQSAPEVVLGKNSGTDSIKLWLERVGKPMNIDEVVMISEDKVMSVLQKVKARACQKKGLLTLRDFENILMEVGI
jgi:isopropylmalate/homocitrate/citramalate synthase